MNLFAVDQGTLLECFCLHPLATKLLANSKLKKLKYGHLSGTALNKQVNLVCLSILQCLLTAKSFSSKPAFCKTCLCACP